jgi:hypothetical protein
MIRNAEKLLAAPLAGAYLDTSVVRSYSGTDTWLKHASTHTSILTVIELLDGATVTQKEYFARRAAIRRLLDFEIPIARYLPIVTVMRAFPYVHDSVDLSTKAYYSVMTLAAAMIEIESSEQFDILLKNSPVWLSLQAEYSSFARNYVGSFTAQTKELRHAFSSSPAPDLAKLGIDDSLSTSARMRQFTNSPFNRAASLFALAKSAAVSIGQGEDVATERAIYESYNQLARPYVDVISVAFVTRMGNSELPTINDLYDQEHFAYLEPNVLLVSNDKRMRGLASTIGQTAVDSAEFRSMAQIEIAKRQRQVASSP